MFSFVKTKFFLNLSLLAALSVPGSDAFAYSVSGVVDFSYLDNIVKQGNARTEDQSWTQNYQTSFQDYLLDRRAINYNVDLGYAVTTHKNSLDSRNLNYGLSTSFFPGMKVSGDAFLRDGLTTVQSNVDIAGMQYKTQSYGGTVNFALSRGRGFNGANNYNSNNNSESNNTASPNRLFTLPDITLARVHTSSEAVSTLNPLHESLDTTMASARSRIQDKGDINLDGQMDKYRDLHNNSSYDAHSLNLSSTLAVLSDATFGFVGRYADRTTDNMAGFSSWERSLYVSSRLDFKEVKGFRHYYYYNLNEQTAAGSKSVSNSLNAGANYTLSESWSAQGAASIANAQSSLNSTQTATATSLGSKATQDSVAVSTGVAYQKTQTPAMLNPFVLNTRYSFNIGYGDYSSSSSTAQAGTVLSGTGFFIGNTAGVGLASTGWQTENLSMDYQYQNKRDFSPVHNDFDIQSLRLNFTSRRFEKTTLHAIVTYTDQRYKSNNISTDPLAPIQNNTQNSQSTLYDTGADYAASNYLTLSAGASRGDTKSNTYTLSQLTPVQSSSMSALDDQIYGSANFSYPLTRYLTYMANARDEYHHSRNTNLRVQDVDMKLNYRIRMLLFSLDAHVREEDPSGSPRVEQQYYFAQVTRPF
jgi:hypothetical protein